MIVELFLIGQLLSKRQFVDIPAVVGPAYDEKPPDAPKPIFEVDPEAFADVIKLKRFF